MDSIIVVAVVCLNPFNLRKNKFLHDLSSRFKKCIKLAIYIFTLICINYDINEKL